ncbi:hypothetical protein BKM78_11305 [Tessaracoccus sp. T2.5-30]|nr:hypothetical protein BKM78_11305 [Tessaracoccus sp. T2.5-30]
MSVSASPSRTPEPSPSPTVAESFPPAPASESPEQAAVRAAWMEYWRVYQKFAQDPSVTDWSETQLVTTGEESGAIISAIGDLKDRGWRSLGGLEFRDIQVVLTPGDAEGPNRAEVTYCLDRSDVSIVDAESGVAVAVGGSATLRESAELEHGADGIWRVSKVRNEPQAC